MPESFFNKVAGLRPATLRKKRLWHSCFTVNFVKFSRTSFYRTPPLAVSVFLIEVWKYKLKTIQ